MNVRELQQTVYLVLSNSGHGISRSLIRVFKLLQIAKVSVLNAWQEWANLKAY